MRAVRTLAAATATLAGLGLTVGLAAPASAASSYSVSLHTNHTYINYGSSIRLGGKVSGGPVSGRSVSLYWTRASEDDTWHKFGTAKLSKHGYFHRYFKPPFGGDIKFRARKAHVGTHHSANGYSGVTAVYQWDTIWRYYNNGLDVEPGSNGATVHRGSATIDGTTYPGSVLINDGASVGYTTYQCKGLRGLVGIPDSSSQSVGTLEMAQASDPFGSVTAYQLHAPLSISTPLNANRSLTLSGDVGGNGGTESAVALARPQVLCDAPAE